MYNGKPTKNTKHYPTTKDGTHTSRVRLQNQYRNNHHLSDSNCQLHKLYFSVRAHRQES